MCVLSEQLCLENLSSRKNLSNKPAEVCWVGQALIMYGNHNKQSINQFFIYREQLSSYCNRVGHITRNCHLKIVTVVTELVQLR